MSDSFSVEPVPEPPPGAAAPESASEDVQAVHDEDADASEQGVVVAAPGTQAAQDAQAAHDARAAQAGAAADTWSMPFRRRVMGALENKGVGSATLIVAAIACAVIAAMCISIQHHGFGALLGLIAVGLGWIARTPRDVAPGRSDPALPFVHAVSEIIPALLVGGFVLDQARVPFHVLVRTALLAGCLLLPLIRAIDAGRNLPRSAVMISWGERLGLLLVGTLLGNPKLIVLLVAIIVAADVLARLTLIRPRNLHKPAMPPGLAACFGPDGAVLAPIRWGILAVSLLLCLVFGTEDGWRF